MEHQGPLILCVGKYHGKPHDEASILASYVIWAHSKRNRADKSECIAVVIGLISARGQVQFPLIGVAMSPM